MNSIEHKAFVLVVDDEPSGFAVIEALLHRENYSLVYASSGGAALDQLTGFEPDVILLDVMMPNMDGMEVCRRIKTSPVWKHIPVIMVTALSAKEDLARAMDAGADDFLTKPVNGVELRARVRSMLRIKQQYDAMKATLQMREDMSNMVVHDLRNPIATILLSSHMLMAQGDLQGKQVDRVQMIQAAGQQLNSMINDLLLLAKMESGKMMLNRTDVDLQALATVVLSNFQEIARSRKVSLDSQLPQENRWISADANLLYRLLDNLLSNAIKFSPPNGQVMLRIEYFATLSSEEDALPDESVIADENASSAENTVKHARIQVCDQGPGVREELRQQIFSKYEIGDAIAGIPQIGLGLTFSKMVAEAHGGQIVIEDNQPKGAIFTIEI